MLGLGSKEAGWQGKLAGLVKGAGVMEQDGRTLRDEPEALKGEAWWDDKKELNWGKGMGEKRKPKPVNCRKELQEEK